MYPGTIAMKHAARSPAPDDQSSLVRKYVAKAVKPLIVCFSLKSSKCNIDLSRIPEERGKKNTDISNMYWNV